ncbi:hypothetical protein PTKIN_Ptkin16aG0058200 [Pterospermum kingtungense]
MGKKLAVLVGCNYPSTQIELHRCIKDVAAMRDLLVERYGFDSSHVDLLTDSPGSFNLPTGENIKAALQRMVDKAEAGDVLFFHLSGHGTKISSLEPGQPFRQHEAIVPCDLSVITGTYVGFSINISRGGIYFDNCCTITLHFQSSITVHDAGFCFLQTTLLCALLIIHNII